MASDQFLSKVRSRFSTSLPFRQGSSTTQGDGSTSSARQLFTLGNLSRSSIKDLLSGSPDTKTDRGTGNSIQANGHLQVELTSTLSEQLPSAGDSSLPTEPRTINVVLFGETGVGKSSIINLIARKEVARFSSDVNGCTMQSTRYNIPFDGADYAIFDTIGLEDPQMGVNGYLKAIEKAYDLIRKLSAAGGIHLLLFCMRGGRITATAQSNYRLFRECLCNTEVPIALVFTGLEKEVEMEDFWTRNKNGIESYGLKSNGHVCVTAVQDDTPGDDLKYAESQRRIRDLLKACSLTNNDAFLPEACSWYARLGREMRSFIEKHKKPKMRDVMRVLTLRCKLDPETARKIADVMKSDTGTNGGTLEEQTGNAESGATERKEEIAGTKSVAELEPAGTDEVTHGVASNRPLPQMDLIIQNVVGTGPPLVIPEGKDRTGVVDKQVATGYPSQNVVDIPPHPIKLQEEDKSGLMKGRTSANNVEFKFRTTEPSKGEIAIVKVTNLHTSAIPQNAVDAELRTIGLDKSGVTNMIAAGRHLGKSRVDVDAELHPVRRQGSDRRGSTTEKLPAPAVAQNDADAGRRILGLMGKDSEQSRVVGTAVSVDSQSWPRRGHTQPGHPLISVRSKQLQMPGNFPDGKVEIKPVDKQVATGYPSQNIVDIPPHPIKSEDKRMPQSHSVVPGSRTEKVAKGTNDPNILALEETVKQLRTQLAEAQGKADKLTQLLQVHEQKHHCETLYAEGRSAEAAVSLLEIINTMSGVVKANKLLTAWIASFTDRCISTLKRFGDEAWNVEEREKATLAYSIFLSLGPSTPNTVLARWTQMILTCGSANDVLEASTEFKLPRSLIYRTICDVLETNGRVPEAIMCFRQMQSELAGDMNACDEWDLGFQRRCLERLEKLGSVAMDSKNYSKAAEHFSTILSLDLVDRMEALIKRSKARVQMKSWKDALTDADEGIRLYPSSHQGYEMRHAALHGARRYAEAVEAFRMMLSKLEESPDEPVRGLRRQYIDVAPTIQHIVEEIVRDLPLVLIDTTTGHLYDKKKQAEAFKALPKYNELLSSMTTKTGVDEMRIRTEVQEFFRYVMLSHKWENGEPLLQKVEHITVYKLDVSSANMKLRDFCTLVRSLGFRWAWSDTCCVDKDNKRVLEESLVAMFTWYRGSSLTVVYLRGVSSLSQKPDGLRGSIWNTRAWTYQEYVAAKAVQFYTEDWKPYLGLAMFNHKDSPVVISEMQQVAVGSAKDIIVLRPGLDMVREKLSLASMRRATYVEDIAYSLLGVFKASIPIQYGERDRAVGRLLEYILTGSGNVVILAWTGHAGGYNSCLPIDLTVYNQVLPPHVPQPIENFEMNRTVATLRSSLPDLSLAKTLYHRLIELPPPMSLSSRLRLPGIVFRLARLVGTSTDPGMRSHVYHATTSTFGDVEIKTADDLAETRHLYLIHPWIRPLLDQEFTHGAAELDETTQAIRFVARLRQPFGALLLEQVSRMEYRRVAADSLIMIRIREEVPLTDLICNLRTIEIQ